MSWLIRKHDSWQDFRTCERILQKAIAKLSPASTRNRAWLEKAAQLIKGDFSCRAKKEFGLKWEIRQKGFSEVQILTEDSFLHHQNYIAENPEGQGWPGRRMNIPIASHFSKRRKKAAAAKAGS
ncbi:MAG TPA: hypothetical protein VI488_12950 [Candidatus Angelobacter sp.]